MKTAAQYIAVPRRAAAERSNGFTLVELLAVMLIMAVLVSLVVAVGNWVREDAARSKTTTIQDIAMQAVKKFHEEVGRYPGIDEDGNVDPDLSGAMPSGPENDETTAVLLEYLQAEDSRVDFSSDDDLVTAIRVATRQTLTDLPEGAMDESNSYLLDGYEQRMHYDPEGGLGGRRPVLISAGPDGKFDTEDDILSDGG
ncbi:MAG: type II secretion system protein [Phycisphaerae bacterium]